MQTSEFLSLTNEYGPDTAWDVFWASFQADHLLGMPEGELEASYDRITGLYDKIRGSRDVEVMAAKSLFRKAKFIGGKHPVDLALERNGGMLWSRKYIDGYYHRKLTEYYGKGEEGWL